MEIEGLGYTYEDGTVALRNVSVTVDVGEKVAVIGPNAAGKSTLLHLIAGFRTPFTGTVRVMGEKLEEKSADRIRRGLGLLFQDPDDQLFMPTVKEDVAFGPRNLGLDDAEGRAMNALRSVGADHLSDKRPHRLSYGMKRRVAIAGIMAMDPEVLLLDEPTSGLDPRSRSELVRLLKGMDRTMIIATHDIEAAAEIVDRAVVLNVEPVMEGTMRDLVFAHDVLGRTGLEIPPVSKLFKVLGSMGYPVGTLPISMDQAVKELSRVIEREGERLHAHIHAHEHEPPEERRGRARQPAKEGRRGA